jgi:hypothetical protein
MITTINYIRERVNTVQKILMVNGFNKNKIVIIEGKGRVLLTNNPLENLTEVRSKNRRVDMLIVRKIALVRVFTFISGQS